MSDQDLSVHERWDDLTCENCVRLTAERDALVAKYDAEVAEFNAGYDAAKRGDPESAEPTDTRFDVWVAGYAWGKFDQLKAERAALAAAVVEEQRLCKLKLWSLASLVAEMRDACSEPIGDDPRMHYVKEAGDGK